MPAISDREDIAAANRTDLSTGAGPLTKSGIQEASQFP
jgi:hypothetical protein